MNDKRWEVGVAKLLSQHYKREKMYYNTNKVFSVLFNLCTCIC